MSNLVIKEPLASKIRQIAEAQQRSAEELLNEFVDQYGQPTVEPVVIDMPDAVEDEQGQAEAPADPLESLIGLIDSDQTGLSVGVREAYLSKKSGETG
jgi:hypothetical protein